MKKARVIDRAVLLRQQGYSLQEISKILGISKSTASIWLSEIKIDAKGKERLIKINEAAIVKSRETNNAKRLNRINNIENNCQVLTKRYKFEINEQKLLLSLLYWCEGTKGGSRIIFMNSDPNLIRTYLALLRSSFEIDECKLTAILHLHAYHDTENQKNLWSDITGIRQNKIKIYKKKNTGVRKKVDYQGCISIRYGNVSILDEIKIIISRFIDNTIAGVG